MTVMTTAWRAAGAPVRSDIAVSGVCARCGQRGELTSARAVISKSFTGFESWVDPSGLGLCPSCCWGYATPELRLVPHLVTVEPAALTALSKADVSALLAAGGLAAGQAVIVPLRPGRKHLLPTAHWGRVTVDDAHLSWNVDDARRLQTVQQLRDLGFGTRMLGAGAPPFTALRKLPAQQWSTVIDGWAQLDPWRAGPSPWLALALHITVPPTSEKSAP